MFKKIGISLLLSTSLLVFTFGVENAENVYATPTSTCTTVSECRERQREVQENIEQLLEEEEEISGDIAQTQAEISDLRDEISSLEINISNKQHDLALLGEEIAELLQDIEENLEILEETKVNIEDLLEEMAERMRIAQHANNRNSIFNILNEAQSFVDLIRQVRTFTRFAEEDAEIMKELTGLIEAQDNLLIALDSQQEDLQTRNDEFEEQLVTLEIEQSSLEVAQLGLIEREAVMQDRLYQLSEERLDEETLLAALENAEEILRRTPPPPVRTNNGAAQTPNASGLAHPIPGAVVTDEFGTRGGRHRGIDLAVPGNPSAPILAAASGVVVVNEWEPGFGYYIVISHMINGERVDTLYAHLRERSPIGIGVTVAQGDVVGTKGNTGVSFGAHLHFEVHPGGLSWGSGRGDNPRNWIAF